MLWCFLFLRLYQCLYIIVLLTNTEVIFIFKKRLPLVTLLVLHLNNIPEINLSVILELFDTNSYNIPVTFFVFNVPLMYSILLWELLCKHPQQTFQCMGEDSIWMLETGWWSSSSRLIPFCSTIWWCGGK